MIIGFIDLFKDILQKMEAMMAAIIDLLKDILKNAW
jgi:hypothetical protein